MNLGIAVPVLDPKAKVQPIFVQDVAQAIVNAVASTSAPGQTYNIAGPDTFTYEELMDMIKHEIVRPECFVQKVPAGLARLLGKAFEFGAPVKWRLLSPDLVDQMKVDQTLKFNDLTDALLVNPTSLRRELSALCLLHSGDRVPYRFE